MIKISWSCSCDFVTLKLFPVSSQRLCASESSPLLTYYSGLVICVSHYMEWNAPSSFQPQVIPGSWFRQSLKPSLLSQDHNLHGNTNSYLDLHPTPLPAIIRVIPFSALMLKMTLDNFSTLLFCILSHCLVRCHIDLSKMTALSFWEKNFTCFHNALSKAQSNFVIKSWMLSLVHFKIAFPEPDERLQNDFWQLSNDNGILATMLFLVYKKKVTGFEETV